MTKLTMTIPVDTRGMERTHGSSGVAACFKSPEGQYWLKSYNLPVADAEHSGTSSSLQYKVELRTVAELISSRLAFSVVSQMGLSDLVVPEYRLVLHEGEVKGLCSQDVPGIVNSQDFGINRQAVKRLIQDKRMGVLHALRWLLQDPDGLENTFYQFEPGTVPKSTSIARVVALDWGLACYPLLQQERVLFTEAEIHRAPNLNVFEISESSLQGCDISGSAVPGLLHEAHKWDLCLLMSSIDSNWTSYANQESDLSKQFHQDAFAVVAGFHCMVSAELLRICGELVEQVPSLARSVDCVKVYLERHLQQLHCCCEALLRGGSPRSVVVVDGGAQLVEQVSAQVSSKEAAYPASVLLATLAQFQQCHGVAVPLLGKAKPLKFRLGFFGERAENKVDAAQGGKEDTATSAAVQLELSGCGSANTSHVNLH